MRAKKGIWEISDGKGDRVYINCHDMGKTVMHPQDISGMNGMGMYGYEHLKDLAVAILRFEKEKQNSESILNDVEE